MNLSLLVELASSSLYKIHINRKFFDIYRIFKIIFNSWNSWNGKKTLHLYDHSENWCSIIKIS